MDDLDDILISEFKLFKKNRLFERKASGGVPALVSEKITSNVTNVKQQESICLHRPTGAYGDIQGHDCNLC